MSDPSVIHISEGEILGAIREQTKVSNLVDAIGTRAVISSLAVTCETNARFASKKKHAKRWRKIAASLEKLSDQCAGLTGDAI